MRPTSLLQAKNGEGGAGGACGTANCSVIKAEHYAAGRPLALMPALPVLPPPLLPPLPVPPT